MGGINPVHIVGLGYCSYPSLMQLLSTIALMWDEMIAKNPHAPHFVLFSPILF